MAGKVRVGESRGSLVFTRFLALILDASSRMTRGFSAYVLLASSPEVSASMFRVVPRILNAGWPELPT